MKKLLTRLSRYYHFFYIALVFSATIFLLYLIIPGESRFQYEFQKNTPWRHETLIAPFDFAIYKPDEVVEVEKDSIQNEFIPYFNSDSLIGIQQTQNFKLKLESVRSEMPILTPATIFSLYNYLATIYNAGVISQSPDSNPIIKDKSEIYEVKGKVAEKVPVTSIYSLKSAFSNLSDSVRALMGEEQYQVFTQNVNLADYIQQNLTYNEEFSDQKLDELVSSISLTQGMIQSGERIIFKGDIITPDKYLILESLKKSYESKLGQNFEGYLLILGKLILIVSCILILILYLLYFRPEIFKNKRHISFILMMIVLMTFVSRFVISQDNLSIYLVPIIILPILLRIFFDSRTAIFTLLVASLLIGYFAPNNYEFIFLSMVSGIIAVFSLDKLHRRSHLVFTAIWTFISYAIVYLALSMVQEGNIESIQWEELRWFFFNSLLILFAYPLIYIFEKLFGFISDVTLIELSNTNQPLLRKLADEAPGTFQHSLQIANLAEAVIHKIGGNPFLVYAGALYHDIGKTNQPVYFVENQSDNASPHKGMDYKESAKVIIDHVNYGVKLAHRYKLPEILIDFIRSHHGTTQAKYFYTLYKNENPENEVDAADFTYPGPRPKSKETSVVMLIDGIEAAVRSLKEKTHESIREKIEVMVNQKLDDGQLDNADLTLRDITTIKEILIEKLLNIYHVRIEYPEEKKK